MGLCTFVFQKGRYSWEGMHGPLTTSTTSNLIKKCFQSMVILGVLCPPLHIISYELSTASKGKWRQLWEGLHPVKKRSISSAISKPLFILCTLCSSAAEAEASFLPEEINLELSQVQFNAYLQSSTKVSTSLVPCYDLLKTTPNKDLVMYSNGTIKSAWRVVLEHVADYIHILLLKRHHHTCNQSISLSIQTASHTQHPTC